MELSGGRNRRLCELILKVCPKRKAVVDVEQDPGSGREDVGGAQGISATGARREDAVVQVLELSAPEQNVCVRANSASGSGELKAGSYAFFGDDLPFIQGQRSPELKRYRCTLDGANS